MKSLPFRISACVLAASFAMSGLVGGQAQAAEPAAQAPVATESVKKEATFTMKQAQWNLAFLGLLSYKDIDGIKGKKTIEAINLFQAARCLRVDGILGDNSVYELKWFVGVVQFRTTGRSGDGLAGPASKAALESYQFRKGLRVTGHADAETLATFDLPLVRQCAKSSVSMDSATARSSAQ